MAKQIILLLLLLPCMALAAPYGGMYPDAISSADIPDPLVPLDGCQGITGDLEVSGTVTGATLTDGTATYAAGSITSGVNATFSGTVTGGTITDGTAMMTGGVLTDPKIDYSSRSWADANPLVLLNFSGMSGTSSGNDAIIRWSTTNHWSDHDGLWASRFVAPGMVACAYVTSWDGAGDVVLKVQNDAGKPLSAQNTAGTEIASISSTGIITGSALEVSGSVTATQGTIYDGQQTITAATDTLVLGDHIIQVDASGNSVNITLPTASGNAGKWYGFKSTAAHGGNTITITAHAAELIDGANTCVLLAAQWDYLQILCNGTGWLIQ